MPQKACRSIIATTVLVPDPFYELFESNERCCRHGFRDIHQLALQLHLSRYMAKFCQEIHRLRRFCLVRRLVCNWLVSHPIVSEAPFIRPSLVGYRKGWFCLIRLANLVTSFVRETKGLKLEAMGDLFYASNRDYFRYALEELGWFVKCCLNASFQHKRPDFLAEIKGAVEIEMGILEAEAGRDAQGDVGV